MSVSQIQIRKKGQMTLPAEVRHDLGVDDGDKIYLQKIDGRYHLVTADQVVDPSAGALAKYGNPEKPFTIEEMDQAVRDGVLESWDRFVRETDKGYDE